MSLQSALRLLAHVEGPMLAARIDDGTIVTVNRPFAGLVGYSQMALIGNSVEMLFPASGEQPALSLSILGQDGPMEDLALGTASGAALHVRVLRWHLARNSDSPLCALALEPGELSTRLAEVLASKHQALEQSLRELQKAFNGLELKKDELNLRNREQAALHAKLARSMRLAAIGELSAGMAHTLRNPLAALCSTLARLRRLLHAPGADLGLCDELIGRGLATCDRIGSIIERFQRLSPAAPIGGTPSCLLAEEVQVTLELLSHRCAPEISIEVQIPAGTRVAASSVDLHLVLSNLIDNALNAVQERGHILVKAETGSEAVLLRVQDSGPGVAPELRDRLFEPFVTSRPEGCGIGLSLVRAAVERSGGTVDLVPGPMSGAAFVVRLPAPTAGWHHEYAATTGR
ncbi:MAG: ATP-binding protein [Pseudomonadota bacterium]